MESNIIDFKKHLLAKKMRENIKLKTEGFFKLSNNSMEAARSLRRFHRVAFLSCESDKENILDFPPPIHTDK